VPFFSLAIISVICAMKKLLFSLLLAPVVLWGQLNGPESVDCDTLTNTWYVGNTGSGKILRRSLPATAWQDFASGMSSGPHGIEVLGDRVYACSGGAIRGFQLSDGASVFTKATGATFLNGLTHDDLGNLYATDFSAKKIYKINPDSNTSSVFVANTTSTPNGIIFDKANNRLVYVSWGGSAKIYAVSLADSSTTLLKTTSLSNIDGVAMDKEGRVYVASWGANALHRFNADLSGSPTLIASGLNSPADIFYNLRTDTIGIPNSGNNTVKFVGTAPTSATAEAAGTVSLMIFPNPATDWLAVALPAEMAASEAAPTIHASTGQRMAARVLAQDKEKIVVDIADFPPGLYRISMQVSEGKSAVGTFFKR
jgi:hypothetical protein